MALKQLEVYTREVKYNDKATGKPKSFTAFNTFDVEGKKLDVRFVKDAIGKVTENCIIIVDETQMNIATQYRYPRLYVQDIVEVKPLERVAKELPFANVIE